MYAMNLAAPRRFERERLPLPKIGENDVRIRVEYCGICGSELHAYFGKHRKRVPPVVLGHELSGRICALGGTVRGIKLKDPVTVVPMYGCGECPECLRGEVSLCSDKIILGSQAWPGGFAEYLSAPARLVYRLPEGVSLVAGALVEPLAVALHAVRSVGVFPGDTVCVLGAGPIGLCTIAMARQAGATGIFATDIRKFNLRKALACGATQVFDAADHTFAERMRSACGRGCDVAFIAAPAPQLFEQAIYFTRKQGKICMVAMFDDPVPVPVETIRMQEKILSGTSMYYARDFERVIELLDCGRIDVEPLITHMMGLSEVGRAFALLEERVEDVVKILLRAGQ